MTRMLVLVVISMCIAVVDCAIVNLFKNPSIEQPLESDIWACPPGRCKWERTDEEAHTGNYSLKVTHRNGQNQGMEQGIDQASGLVPGGLYFASAYIKFINPSKSYQRLELFVQLTDEKNKYTKAAYGKTTFVRQCNGWTKISAEFKMNKDTAKASVAFIVGETDEVGYYLDTAMLYQVQTEANWKDNANRRINKIRKGDVIFNTKVAAPYKPDQIVLWINQTEQAFPLGASVAASYMYRTDDVGKRYQEYVYKMFNWVTFSNAAKYRFMEPEEGMPKFSTLDQALDAVNSRGITNVRGHSVTWGKENKILDWLKKKSPEEITANVYRRCDYLAEHFGNRFAHWDVNNEYLHGHWYEDNTGNWQFTPDLITKCYRANNSPRFCTNDFHAVSSGMYTSQYQELVQSYIKAGIPVNGMGLQSHYSGGDAVEIDVVKFRLDRLSMSGVPLWITEFDMRDLNETYRAEATEDLLRLYFSHPGVQGIILWSFWDQASQFADTALVTGNDLQDNEVGMKVAKLFLDEWRTKSTVLLSKSSSRKTMRAFYGKHNLMVLDGGEEIGQYSFEFKRGQTPEINIDIGQNGVKFTSNI